jgi:hypothetical protein
MPSIKQVVSENKTFFVYYLLGLVLLALTYHITPVVSWIAFSLAALSAIGNDSIQTLGTFLSSNKHSRWWVLWIFIGAIFVGTVLYGFFVEQDVAFGRLANIDPVQSFTFLQVFAPMVLILLTKFKIPISTTFLLLSVFATGATIEKMLLKSFMGYAIALVVGVVVFGVLRYMPFIRGQMSETKAWLWRTMQWITTGFLWSSWLMQDTANIVVFLPRDTTVFQLMGILLVGVLVLGAVLYRRGGEIQSLVEEKIDVTDVRAATFIDLTLALVLIYFKEMNSIPMSTTWVFLGLLAGRELILSYLSTATDNGSYNETLKLVGKDMILASIGVIISIGLAYLVNL